MIGKVSESLALRKAFPAELSGLYTVEEFPPPEPEQIAEPSTKTPTPIELRKEAALDNLEILGWDKSQQREWGTETQWQALERVGTEGMGTSLCRPPRAH